MRPHGGAAAALLMRAFERLPAPDGLSLARVTYELLRPVPVGPVETEAEIARPGRRVQLLEGSISAGGTEVVRARALRVQRPTPVTAPSRIPPPPPGPAAGRPAKVNVPHRPMFAPDAIEIRFVAGAWGGGPSTAWFRLRGPIVPRDALGLQRLASAGDFGNGMSSILSWDDYLYINPDLTLCIERGRRPVSGSASRPRRGSPATASGSPRACCTTSGAGSAGRPKRSRSPPATPLGSQRK